MANPRLETHGGELVLKVEIPMPPLSPHRQQLVEDHIERLRRLAHGEMRVEDFFPLSNFLGPLTPHEHNYMVLRLANSLSPAEGLRLRDTFNALGAAIEARLQGTAQTEGEKPA